MTATKLTTKYEQIIHNAPMEDDWLVIEIELVTINYIFHRFYKIILAVPSAECCWQLSRMIYAHRMDLIGPMRSCWQTFASVRQLKNREWTNSFARACIVCVWLMVASVLLFWPRAWREMGDGGGGVVGRRIVPYHAGIVLYHVAAVKCEAINIEIANTLETDTRTDMKKRAASSSRGEV